MTHEEEPRIQALAKFSRFFRAEIDADAAEEESNDDHQLWLTARLFIRSISSRFRNFNHPVAHFEYDLHDLWYQFIQVAKITGADHPAQDRLVNQVVFARELGTLTRALHPTMRTQTSSRDDSAQNQAQEQGQEEATESAIMRKGRMWTDLPFLLDDLRETWKASLGTRQMSPRARCNLAAFTARLIAYGICDSELSLCALWVLRDALETPRELTSALAVPISTERGNGVEAEQEQEQQDSSQVAIVELLPACRAFVEYSCSKLMILSMRNHTFPEIADLSVSCLGDLAQDHVADTGSGMPSQAGFSRGRWDFWKGRLQQLGVELQDMDGCGDVARDASRGFNIMRLWEEQMGWSKWSS